MTRSPPNLTLNDLTTLNLKLTEPYDENLIRKYVIEKCHIKYLPQSIYSLCMYLYPLHIQGKQWIRRYGVCVPTCLSTPALHFHGKQSIRRDRDFCKYGETIINSLSNYGCIWVCRKRIPTNDVQVYDELNTCYTSGQGPVCTGQET